MWRLEYRANSNSSGRKGKRPKQVSRQEDQALTLGNSRHMQETPATPVANETQGIQTDKEIPRKDKSTPSNRPRDNLFTLDIVYHSVNGAKERLSADMTRTTKKLKFISAHMLKHLIDIYFIQETWLEGSDDFMIGEITFLMHALKRNKKEEEEEA
jgi:hypothetical protein